MSLKLKPAIASSPKIPFSWDNLPTSPSVTTPSDPPSSPATQWLDAKHMKIFGAEPLRSEFGIVRCSECDKPVLRSAMLDHAERCRTIRNGGKKGAKADGKKRKADEEDGFDEDVTGKKKKPATKITKGRMKGPVDLDRQCGVINDKNLPCSRALTCKSHAMGAKRAVQGRSKSYDELLNEFNRERNPNYVEPPKRQTKAERKEQKEKEKAEKKRLAGEAAAAAAAVKQASGGAVKKGKKSTVSGIRGGSTVQDEPEDENMDDVDSEAELDSMVKAVRSARTTGVIGLPLAIPCDAGSCRAIDGPSNNKEDKPAAISAPSIPPQQELQNHTPSPPFEGKNKGKATREDIQSIPVDTTSVTIKEKVLSNKSSSKMKPKLTDKKLDSEVEAILNNAFSNTENTSERVKVPPVWPMEDLDNILEFLFEMTCSSVADDTGNAQSVANAHMEGVKIRDFATIPINEALTEARYREVVNSTVPEVFNARQKALDFYYMRLLFSQGIFDLPSSPLTVEDVDRLYTIGYITKSTANFVTGSTMLGRGAYRRVMRETGLMMYDGKRLAPRGRWTIPVDSACPTPDEVRAFYDVREKYRAIAPEMGCSEYRLPADWRPALSRAWINHHRDKYGRFGLKNVGIDDKTAAEQFVKIPDWTYIPPTKYESFVAARANRPLTTLFDAWGAEDAAAAAAVAAPALAPEPVDGLRTEPRAASDVVSLNRPADSDDDITPRHPSVALPPSSPPQNSGFSKGKKRARCNSDEETSDDGSSRCTRPRTLHVESCDEPASSSPPASPCAARAQRCHLSKVSPMRKLKPTISAKAQGKKRAREEESEMSVESEDGPSPVKKCKEADVTTPLSPALTPISASPVAVQHLSRHALKRHGRKKIDYEKNEFTELSPTDIRRDQGDVNADLCTADHLLVVSNMHYSESAMTAPIAIPSNARLAPGSIPHEVGPVAGPIQSEARAQLDDNWSTLCAGFDIIRRGGEEVHDLMTYSPSKSLGGRSSRISS
ncbi:hypothetical protein EW145_g1692 [Phellinidium pouzarii]|uniref:SCA7 domain-containing protein n=1 Tax=Phellinidium pouzarii TaxID=167371 RepID=A0A4S4LDJ8_9AGAM|nr:hypothetical protein EW145_g1692 [Phellinidium pouzarii]